MTTKKIVVAIILQAFAFALVGQEAKSIDKNISGDKIPAQIKLVSKLLEKIQKEETFSMEDEVFFFGQNRSLLGESIYHSLNMGEYDHMGYFTLKTRKKDDISLLAKQLSKKLYPLIANKNNAEYTIASSVYFKSAGSEMRITDHDGITVSVRVVGPEVPFWSSGTTLLFKLIPNKDRSKWYINLISSSVGNIPFHEFLGFKGKYPSDFKLSDDDLKSLLKD